MEYMKTFRRFIEQTGGEWVQNGTYDIGYRVNKENKSVSFCYDGEWTKEIPIMACSGYAINAKRKSIRTCYDIDRFINLLKENHIIVGAIKYYFKVEAL